MPIVGLHGEYYNFPLRTQPHVKWDDPEFGKLKPETVMMTILRFRILHAKYPSMEVYEASAPFIEWECIGCAEAGNKWVGIDPEEHGKQHQMGFDYAVMWLEKQEHDSIVR